MHATPTPPPAIALRGLTKRFKGRAAVEGLTLEIPRGSVCGLLGGNSREAGTLLQMGE